MNQNKRENYNACKGHQGFIKKYQILGETQHIRIPKSIVKKVKNILILLESVAYDKGINKVDEILDKIIEGLEKV